MDEKKHFGTTGLFAQPIGNGLNKFHKSIFDKSTLELIRLGTNWQRIVGEIIANDSSPTKLQYSKNYCCLHIKTSAAFSLEIQHMQPIIIQRVSEILGHNKVQNIKLIQNS